LKPSEKNIFTIIIGIINSGLQPSLTLAAIVNIFAVTKAAMRVTKAVTINIFLVITAIVHSRLQPSLTKAVIVNSRLQPSLTKYTTKACFNNIQWHLSICIPTKCKVSSSSRSFNAENFLKRESD
jgi:hypothetical protein